MRQLISILHLKVLTGGKQNEDCRHILDVLSMTPSFHVFLLKPLAVLSSVSHSGCRASPGGHRVMSGQARSMRSG